MSEQQPNEPAVPVARREFARRLRELRVIRGFRTARSLARALEIDENRYTRYERAEVEPDLDMISRICLTLGISPADLIAADPAPMQASGAASPQPRELNGDASPAADAPPSEESPGQPLPVASAAWLLAEAAAGLRHAAQQAGARDAPSPLAGVAETGRLYRALTRHPFEAIAELLADPAIVGAGREAAADLKARIDDLLQVLRQGSGRS